MLDTMPTSEEIIALVGKSLYEVWNNLCALINERYDMERLWNKSGKRGNMNTNTVVAVKRFALYMQKKIV